MRDQAGETKLERPNGERPSMPTSYTTDKKIVHRRQVLEQVGGGKVLYLDGERGEASKFFVREGLNMEQLYVVNNDETICKRLRRRFKCSVQCGDIFEVMKSYDGDFFSVVWLDLEEVFVTRPDAVPRLSLARKLSKHVFLTTSVRTITYEKAFDLIDETALAAGFWAKSKAYKGVNGAHMTFSELHASSSPPMESTVHDTLDERASLEYSHLLSANIVTHSAKYLGQPFITVYRDAVYRAHGATKYRATSTGSEHAFYVHACDPCSPDFVKGVDAAWKNHYKHYILGKPPTTTRVPKILARLPTSHSSGAVKAAEVDEVNDAPVVTAATRIDPKSYVGTRLLVPTSYPNDYKFGKDKWTVHDKVECIVSGTYFKNRLTVRAFRNDGTQCPKTEDWTPFPWEVDKFRVTSGRAHIVQEKDGD